MNLLRSSAEGFLQGAGIVQIQHATFFVRLHHLNLTATCPDDRTSARFQRRLHQFVIQVGGENNRMPAPSLVNRQNDGLARGVKSLDQLTHQSRTNKRMVDQEQNHSISFCRNTPQSSLDRTQLPFFPILIDDDLVQSEIDFFRDRLGIGTENHAPHADFWMTRHVQQMLKERASLIGKERLWRSHPARCATREDDGSEHATSFNVPLGPDAVRRAIFYGPPTPRSGECQSVPPPR